MLEKWKDVILVLYSSLCFVGVHVWRRYKDEIILVSCVLCFVGVLIYDNPIFGIGVGICCIMSTWYGPGNYWIKRIGYTIGGLCIFTNLFVILGRLI